MKQVFSVLDLSRRAAVAVLGSSLIIASLIIIATSNAPKALSSAANVSSTKTVNFGDPFTVVVLPDTQLYSQDYAYLYESQTNWIVKNLEKKNIVYVSHLGDIVELPDNTSQWEVASSAMSKLDGKVPYGIAPGNHDINYATGTSNFSKYFSKQRVNGVSDETLVRKDLRADLTNADDQLENNRYRLFSTGVNKFIGINLEFCPDDKTLQWTSDLLTRYSDRTAIVTSHSFTKADGNRQTGDTCADYGSTSTNNGEEIYQKLIVKDGHANVLMFLGGHDVWSKSGGARRTDIAHGKPVHQLLSDYQHMDEGGSGFLRIMTFYPNNKEIKVETYSPYYDEYKRDRDNQFVLDMP